MLQDIIYLICKHNLTLGTSKNKGICRCTPTGSDMTKLQFCWSRTPLKHEFWQHHQQTCPWHILTPVPISAISSLQGSPRGACGQNSLCAKWGQEPVERKRSRAAAASLSHLNQGLAPLMSCPSQLPCLGGIFCAQGELCTGTWHLPHGGWLWSHHCCVEH